MEKIYIKNMVCRRCIIAVENELRSTGINAISVELGEVTLEVKPEEDKMLSLASRIAALGFEILDDQRSQLIEKIKKIIIRQVHYSSPLEKFKLSELLSKELNRDYSFLSSLFSEVEGITIEKYHISQKVERVKEMIVYDQLSLSEIAFENHYSSVAHLSAQFKKTTGLTPKHFKLQGRSQRKFLDTVN